VANPHDELGQLTTVFIETLQRLEHSFAELKRFTADVYEGDAREPAGALVIFKTLALHARVQEQPHADLCGF
jgi:hypothetical protein